MDVRTHATLSGRHTWRESRRLCCRPPSSYASLLGRESRSRIGILLGGRRRTRTMMVTVHEKGTITSEKWRPPMTAVAVGGTTQKDDGTRTTSWLGGNGDCTTEHLVLPPPPPSLADINAAQKRCRLTAMLTTTTTVRMTMGGSGWMYPLWLTNYVMPGSGEQMQLEYMHFNKLR